MYIDTAQFLYKFVNYNFINFDNYVETLNSTK